MITFFTSAAYFKPGGPAGPERPTVTPPALVCEYLAGGSLRAAINGHAEFLAPPQAKIKLLLDTARVRRAGACGLNLLERQKAPAAGA